MFEFEECAEIVRELFQSPSISDSTNRNHTEHGVRYRSIDQSHELIAPKTAKQYLYSNNRSMVTTKYILWIIL